MFTSQQPAYHYPNSPWRSLETIPYNELPEVYRGWLNNTESLTQRLMELPLSIELKLTQCGWGHASMDECTLLHIKPTDAVWLRNIEWCLGEQPLIQGRVVLPKSHINAQTASLQQLKQNSIGELLFQDPELKRLPFQFHINHQDDFCWQRRSVFIYQQQRLLVTEKFNQRFFELVNQPAAV